MGAHNIITMGQTIQCNTIQIQYTYTYKVNYSKIYHVWMSMMAADANPSFTIYIM